MTDDEIYLACMLAIGPWDWKVEQTEFLMDQLNRSLGRKATFEQAMKFVNGYRRYSYNLPLEQEPLAKSVTDFLVGSKLHGRVDGWRVEKLIDTHTVGK